SSRGVVGRSFRDDERVALSRINRGDSARLRDTTLQQTAQTARHGAGPDAGVVARQHARHEDQAVAPRQAQDSGAAGAGGAGGRGGGGAGPDRGVAGRGGPERGAPDRGARRSGDHPRGGARRGQEARPSPRGGGPSTPDTRGRGAAAPPQHSTAPA